MAPLPERLAGLEVLTTATLPANKYYASAIASADDVLRVAAWSTLLDREEVPLNKLETVLNLCRFGAIRLRAFRLFESMWRHDLAEKAATIDCLTEDKADSALMAALLACDAGQEAEAHRQRFLATGRIEPLLSMIQAAGASAGPRSGIQAAVTVIKARPHESAPVHLIFTLLREARDAEAMEALADLLDQSGLHNHLTTLHRAPMLLLKGNPRQCLEQLKLWSRLKTTPEFSRRVQRLVFQTAAQALEELGDYRGAFKAYADMNSHEDGRPIPLSSYPEKVREDAAIIVPDLPTDPHDRHFLMLGFPRSGTTLLENVLAMHDKVETFEEVAALGPLTLHLRLSLPQVTDDASRVAAFVEAREKYHAEFARRRTKPDAPVTIDKMPMRSADAELLKKVMPDGRYIFSIRHPFDVVLSCFKQDFLRNPGMEHFRRFDTAVKFYEFAMERWFSVHTLDDSAVCYLRYDDLVTSFDETVRRVIDFIGVEWTEDLRNFAEGASARSTKTPSYGKVRQGLSIGVQSSWKNYDFLFNTPEAKPLYKWAEFFGYPTS